MGCRNRKIVRVQLKYKLGDVSARFALSLYKSEAIFRAAIGLYDCRPKKIKYLCLYGEFIMMINDAHKRI